MKFKQWLNEFFLGLFQYSHFDRMNSQKRIFSVKVYKNPSQDELNSIIARSNHHEARCIVNNRDIYVWNSNEAIHSDVLHEIGLEFRGSVVLLYIGAAVNAHSYYKQIGNYFVSIVDQGRPSAATWADLMDHVNLQKMLGSAMVPQM